MSLPGSVMNMTKIQLKRTQESIAVSELAARLWDSGRAPAKPFDHNTYIYDLADRERENTRRKAVLDRVAAEFSEILGKPVDATTVLTLEELVAWHSSKDGIEIEQDRLRPHLPSHYDKALDRVCDAAGSEQTTDSAPPTEPIANVTKATTSSSMQHTLKSRRDILDAAIERAIEQAGNDKTADVLLALREMALGGSRPFTGVFGDDGALLYTDGKNELATLTKDALDGRLRRRRKASATVDNRQ